MNSRTLRRVGVFFLAVGLWAASLPSDKPEAVGLSSERLQRINQMIQRYVEGRPDHRRDYDGVPPRQGRAL